MHNSLNADAPVMLMLMPLINTTRSHSCSWDTAVLQNTSMIKGIVLLLLDLGVLMSNTFTFLNLYMGMCKQTHGLREMLCLIGVSS
jgi:hypothetical protein